MTDHQQKQRDQFIDEIADALVERLGSSPHKCVFSSDEIGEFHYLFKLIRDCRTAGRWGVVTIVISIFVGIIALGVRSWVEKLPGSGGG